MPPNTDALNALVPQTPTRAAWRRRAGAAGVLVLLLICAALFASLACEGGPADFSLLLTGPPGTGKTEFAHVLADALDRELVVKASSDLVSPYVGSTEKNLADTFERARQEDAVLLLDEADVVITVGFDPVEYDPALWNAGRKRKDWEKRLAAADAERRGEFERRMRGELPGGLEQAIADYKIDGQQLFFPNAAK